MGYDSIPGTRANLIDGAFRSRIASTQPNILILGTATRGLTYETYQIADISAAEKEFGKTSEMLRVAHEVFEQGARNISLMRIGGTQGKVVIVDSSGNTLTIVPEYRDNYILERFGIIIEASSLDSSLSRLLIFDLIDLQYVYDSDEIKVQDEGLFTVTGIETWPVANVTEVSGGSTVISSVDVVDGVYPTTLPRLGSTAAATLYTGDKLFAPINSNAATDTLLTSSDIKNCASVTKTAGSDGTSMPAIARYAALEYAYQLLDFRDADFVIPCSVYHDMPNIVGTHEDMGVRAIGAIEVTGGPVTDSTITIIAADGTSQVYTAKGSQDTAAAQFLNSGSNDVIAASLKACIEAKQSGKVLVSAVASGKITLTQVTGGTAGNTTIGTSGTTNCTLTQFTGGSATASWDNLAASAVDTFTVGNKKALPTAASGAHPTMGASRADSEDDFLGYVWQYRYRGRIYTFFADSTTPATANIVGAGELTGDTIPAAVYTRFDAAAAAEFRECSFTHQLASFCYDASTNWSTMVGIISTRPPAGFGRGDLADHAGELPDYQILGLDRVIPTAAKNGSGLLGDKFLAGAWSYRNGAIEAATKDSNDGLGRGGLILTTGTSLPNAEPYGIKDTDEALDSNSRPIDIGKHVVVTYDWPLISSGYDGGSRYSHSIVGFLAGKLAVLPENIEPIGTNGTLRKVISTRLWNISQVNDLSFVRAVGLMRSFEVEGGNIIVSCKTAAHPSSDYSRISTIRSVNKVLTGIRALAAPYIGTPFSGTRLLSLQQAIDKYLKEQRTAGFTQGARCTMSYTRADKIIGRLTLQLKMIPPMSIETIVVDTSLAAEEAELT